MNLLFNLNSAVDYRFTILYTGNSCVDKSNICFFDDILITYPKLTVDDNKIINLCLLFNILRM